MSDALTPVAVEDKLRRLVTEITQSQLALADARNAETDAEVALKRAQVRAFFDPECPKPLRGSATVGDRDLWIDKQVMDEWSAHRIAVKNREVAVDHVRAVMAQSEVVRSLGASVRTAYNLAGAS